MTGELFIVATPIGNLEDITLRGLRVLREAQLILAEDTRHTRILCDHHGIGTPRKSLHEHTAHGQIVALAEELAAGARFALVTDAGTPLVSDPGSELVVEAVARGVRVTPVPGASAVLAAVTCAGLPSEGFSFVGFLPRKGKEREQALARLAASPLAVAFFESPRRLADTLDDLAVHTGPDRPIAVCRELTKLHEEVLRGTVAHVRGSLPEEVRGEITVVVGGKPAVRDEAPDAAHTDGLIQRLLALGIGAKDIAEVVHTTLGMPKGDAYERVSRLKAASQSD